MISSFETEILFRITLAVVLGAILGFERERHGKPAGMRTHALVALGAALFTSVSVLGFPEADPARIAAGVVTGIGFLGAGTIFRSQDHVKGLTTAANMWVAAGIGVSIGAGLYMLGVVATILSFIVLQMKKVEKKLR